MVRQGPGACSHLRMGTETLLSGPLTGSAGGRGSASAGGGGYAGARGSAGAGVAGSTSAEEAFLPADPLPPLTGQTQRLKPRYRRTPNHCSRRRTLALPDYPFPL